MKRLGLALVVLLAAVTLLAAGCGGGEVPSPTSTPETTATAPPTATETPVATETPAETPTPTSAEPSGELKDVLDNAAGIESVKYDLVTSGPWVAEGTMTIWQKGDKVKTEASAEGETVINLIDNDAETMYMYMPAQNMAYLWDFSEAPESGTEDLEGLMGYNPTIVGTETIDGKVCLVVTYSEPEEGAEVKMWIWKEKGFPIRAETTTPEGEWSAEYKNIDFSNIPDSVFQLPSGVEIVEFPGYGQ